MLPTAEALATPGLFSEKSHPTSCWDAQYKYFVVRNLQIRNRGNVPGGEMEKRARNTKRPDTYETVVQFLLENTAEVNAKDSFGRVRRS